MNTKLSTKIIENQDYSSSRLSKYSPAWVVFHTKDTPSFKLELIDRIREGVKKLTGNN